MLKEGQVCYGQHVLVRQSLLLPVLKPCRPRMHRRRARAHRARGAAGQSGREQVAVELLLIAVRLSCATKHCVGRET